MEHNNANNSNTSEFKEKLVHLGKVTKVVKGGRNFRWSALIVVGDENGRVGVGLGKAAEVTEAVRKGTEDAKKNLITVPMVGTTIPHEIIGEFGAEYCSSPLQKVPELSRAVPCVQSLNLQVLKTSVPNRCVPTILITW